MNQNNIAANLEDDVTLLLRELARISGCTALSTEFKSIDLESELTRCGHIQQSEMDFNIVMYTSHIST